MFGPEFRQNCHITLTQGNLLEENHYYPFGLPITALINKFVSSVENRHKYQSNEYLEANELRWMDFQARQYDPQLGRFLGIDPLADAGGQQVLSPYHAMGCNPMTMVDPLGLMFYGPSDNLPNYGIGNAGMANIEGQTVMLGGTKSFNFDLNYSIYLTILAASIQEQMGRVAAETETLGADGSSNNVDDPNDGGGKETYSDSRHDIEVKASDYANVLEDYYESDEGGTYHLSIWRFFDIVKQAKDNQAIEFHKAVYDEKTGVYSVPVNLYKTDYWASFGRATLLYRVDEGGSYKNPLNRVHFVGFRDTWDLDTKPWGTRSYFSEIVTRYYDWKLNGTSFKVSYP